MSHPPPPLDRSTLERLRDQVDAIRRDAGSPLPLAQLVGLAAAAPAGAGITVDFAATRELGQAMIVVRLPPAEAPIAPELASLSIRELEVAARIAEGLSNPQIAERLHLSVATVKDHVHHILRKSGLPNRAAVAAALQKRPAR